MPTRWLSLIPAVDRLLKHFLSVKAYFLSKSNVRPYLKKFFEHELAECYLAFISNIGGDFQKCIKAMESNNATVIDAFDAMKTLRKSVQAKYDQQFYGSITLQNLNKCVNDTIVRQFRLEASTYLEKVMHYIDKNYDYESKFKFLYPMKLSVEDLCIENFANIVKQFGIKNVDIDLLFEELIELKQFVENNPQNHDLELAQSWMNFFEKNVAPNMLKICEFVFSVPVSNAMCERVFSLMNTAWRKDRNRLLMKHLESELIIKQNCSLSCREFYDYIKSNEAKHLLSKVSTSEKYKD